MTPREYICPDCFAHDEREFSEWLRDGWSA